MPTAAEHYDRLLAEHYTWMLGGDIESAASAQADLLDELGVRVAPGEEAAAVDLGCGPGPQTLALARLGFTSVLAVDSSRALLDELTEHARAVGVESRVDPVRADIGGVLPGLVASGTAAAVVCMGDTLPHLPDRAAVEQLIAEVAGALRSGGSFVATFRDLTEELHGERRFLHVRGSADRVLTCFLEYVDQDTVQVHDLLHTRQGEAWELAASSYPKLRLSSAWVADRCRSAGLDVRRDELGPRGMRILHCVRP